MTDAAVPVKNAMPKIEIVHETHLSRGRACIKSGKYGLFLELSKNVARKDEPARYKDFDVGEQNISDAYAIRDEIEAFIAMVKSKSH